MAITVDVKPSGVESAYVARPFDVAYDELIEAGYDLISLAQNANLRIQQGAQSDVSRNGNWVREGVIYRPNNTPKLVRVSPIVAGRVDATDAHRNGKEFYPAADAITEALTDSIDFPNKVTNIPTKRFGSNDLAVFAFGGEKPAEAYGVFLNAAGIKEMPVYPVDKPYVDKQTAPFARQMWFRGLVSQSELVGDCRVLHDDYSTRGVRSISGEAGAHDTADNAPKGELYSPDRISGALKRLKLTDLETQLLDVLRGK